MSRELTIKQRKWLKIYVATGNATEAAMQVYDCVDRESAAQMGCQNVKKLQGDMAPAMEAMGITVPFLLQKALEGLDAEAIEYAKFEGKITAQTSHVDFPTRQRYLDTVIKLLGGYAPNKHEVAGPDGGPLMSMTDLIARFRNGGRPTAEDTPEDVPEDGD